MSPLTVFLIYAAVMLAIAAHTVFGVSIPGADIEKSLSPLSEMFSSHHTASSSRANVADQLREDESRSWRDLIPHQEPHPSSSDQPRGKDKHNVADELDRELAELNQDIIHFALHPHKVLSPEESRTSLNDIRIALIRQSGSEIPMDPYALLPYRGELGSADFENYLRAVMRRRMQFGMWPVDLEERHYLLAQLDTHSDVVAAVHDVGVPSKNRPYLAAWQEVARPGSGIYQYLGCFRVPNQNRYMSFRLNFLQPIGRSVARIRVWGPTTMYIKFVETRPPLSAVSIAEARLTVPPPSG